MKWKSGVNIRPVFKEFYRFQLILLPVGQSTNVGFLSGRPASLIMPPAGGPPVVWGIPVSPGKGWVWVAKTTENMAFVLSSKFVFFFQGHFGTGKKKSNKHHLSIRAHFYDHCTHRKLDLDRFTRRKHPQSLQFHDRDRDMCQRTHTHKTWNGHTYIHWNIDNSSTWSRSQIQIKHVFHNFLRTHQDIWKLRIMGFECTDYWYVIMNSSLTMDINSQA